MTEEQTTITIDDKVYLIEDISDTCKQMIATAQQTNGAISMLSVLVQSAQRGAESNMKEAVKLLPEPLEAPSAESPETH
jgi:hypothetical protein|tara:strand:+ start:1470 stop:1706 length:237 start_codon:yes stop_codon:yes gene_type:complete